MVKKSKKKKKTQNNHKSYRSRWTLKCSQKNIFDTTPHHPSRHWLLWSKSRCTLSLSQTVFYGCFSVLFHSLNTKPTTSEKGILVVCLWKANTEIIFYISCGKKYFSCIVKWWFSRLMHVFRQKPSVVNIYIFFLYYNYRLLSIVYYHTELINSTVTNFAQTWSN